MDQRLSLVTLAVRDLDASRAFYVEGLGWRPSFDVPDDVVMLQVGEHVLLSLWARAHFEAEVGPIADGGLGVPPLTLAHNVATDEEVDAVLELAARAGADPVHRGERRAWGGYSGYFGDPDGVRWEIAHAPGDVSALVLP